MAVWNPSKRLLERRHGRARAAPAGEGAPELLREVFPYSQVCRIDFDHEFEPLDPAQELLISDTTFRDGQQARPPYKVEQIVELYDLLHRLSGPQGIIRQSEFFLYSRRDREAVEQCLALGRRFPEIVGWARAVKDDLEAVREAGLRDVGVLTSVSDYHIFLKMGLDRRQAMDKYLGVVRDALDMGLRPHCHFEDVTRADIHGFVAPLALELAKVRQDSGEPLRVRLCDTMGYGVTYPGAALPRSVPKLVRAMIEDGACPGHLLEWHGHNDFHKALINATTAWLYGCQYANGTLLGFGERTGNTPLEALVIEHIALTGRADGLDTRVITDIARYFEDQVGHRIAPDQPFVGRDFNSTKAGVHADGMLKNPEIYNIFDTEKILGRPYTIAVTDKSGASGVAHWLNQRLGLAGEGRVDKRHPGVQRLAAWVKEQYDQGRLTTMGDEELERAARASLPELFPGQFDQIKARVGRLALAYGRRLVRRAELRSMDPAVIEPVLRDFVEAHPFVQAIRVVDSRGARVTRDVARPADRDKYAAAAQDEDLSERGWFAGPMADGDVHVSEGFFTSPVTGALCLTVSGPIGGKGGIRGVLAAEVRFEDLAKLHERGA